MLCGIDKDGVEEIKSCLRDYLNTDEVFYERKENDIKMRFEKLGKLISENASLERQLVMAKSLAKSYEDLIEKREKKRNQGERS